MHAMDSHVNCDCAVSDQRYTDDSDHYERAKDHAAASAGKSGEAVDEATTYGARRQVLPNSICIPVVCSA